MKISKYNQSRLPDREPETPGVNASASTEAVFAIKKERVKVTKKKVKQVSKGLAEIAYSMGHTNDIERFSDEISEDILAAFQLVAKRRNERS